MTLRTAPILLLAVSVAAQAAMPTSPGQTQQQLKLGANGSESIDYLLSLPKGYDQSKERWPLLLFLHGAGERGNDIRNVAKHGPPKLAAQENDSLPFIIASPQCPSGSWWSDKTQLDRLGKLLDHLEANTRVDPDRVYVTGLSMGGYGTWHLAAAMPDRFAAIAPICGGGNPQDAKKLAGLPIWAFHGAKDRVVPLSKSTEMVEAIKNKGGNVKLTVYQEAGHDAWTDSYANPNLYRWLLSHAKK